MYETLIIIADIGIGDGKPGKVVSSNGEKISPAEDLHVYLEELLNLNWEIKTSYVIGQTEAHIVLARLAE
jgi:hypothetical protein